MSPTKPLPRRVYWFRRALVGGVALLMVFGLAQLLGGTGSDDGASKATTTSARTKQTTTPTGQVGPVAPAATGTPGATPVKPKAVLATPDGPCLADEVTVTPSISIAAAGGRIALTLQVTGTRPACTFTVSPKTVVLKVTSGNDRIWSSQDCRNAIPTKAVVVRSAVPAAVPVAWNGRRSDSTCSDATKWAGPGYYHAVAAALGSEPTDVQFRLTLPPRPVVTKTATPKPAAKNSAATATPAR